ncbi:MAG: hypothetical protein WBL44_15570 [Nitrososphaeraceae archaeon]|jgi:hypothetical protein
MSQILYVKKLEPKNKEVRTDKPNHRMLILTILVVVGISSLIGIGFAYMGYTSGHFSEVYTICKDSVLLDVRLGAYPSVDEVNTALRSCDGVTG